MPVEKEIYDDCTINKEMILKGHTGYCKVVEISISVVDKLLRILFEDVQNRTFGWVKKIVFKLLNNDNKKCKQNSTVN